MTPAFTLRTTFPQISVSLSERPMRARSRVSSATGTRPLSFAVWLWQVMQYRSRTARCACGDDADAADGDWELAEDTETATPAEISATWIHRAGHRIDALSFRRFNLLEGAGNCKKVGRARSARSLVS